MTTATRRRAMAANRRKSRNPVIPRHPKNPVGQTKRIASTMQAVRIDLAQAQKLVLATLDTWPTKQNNRYARHNAFYEYLISLDQLNTLVSTVANMLRGGRGPRAGRDFAQQSYKEGTAKAVENLSGLSDNYTRTVTQRLADNIVLRRAALAGARVYEEMQGFAGQTADDLRRVLFDAVQYGRNPHDVAKDIRSRFRVGRRRAERIARTEITGALRRGRWDEARDAEQQLGMEVRLIHYSALIPERTRRSHAKRHGKIVTVEEQADWYSKNGNAINCLCSQTEITIGPDGEPLFGKQLIDKLQKQRAAFLKSAPVSSGDL